MTVCVVVVFIVMFHNFATKSKALFIFTTAGFNPFIPAFLKWTLPSLNLDMSADAKRGFSIKAKTGWQTV